MDKVKMFSRVPSREGISQVYIAGTSYCKMTPEVKHDLKIMLDNYNRYNEMSLRYYNLKKWAMISCIGGLFLIWTFLVIYTRP
jgi:hypothetical protein